MGGQEGAEISKFEISKPFSFNISSSPSLFLSFAPPLLILLSPSSISVSHTHHRTGHCPPSSPSRPST
jgi:hypothetical protein